MKLLRSDIIGLPVGALEEKAKIGVVSDVVVNPDNGTILALIIKTGFLRQERKVVDWQDVRVVEKSGVVVGTVEQLIALEEMVRVEQLIKDGFHLVGLPVFTTSGQKIGRVNNFRFDSVTDSLNQLYVRGFWGPNRIIGMSSIVRIELRKVVVRNNEAKNRAKSELRPAQNS